MNNFKLLVFVWACLLITSLFTVLPIFSARSYHQDLNKKAPITLGPISLDVSHSITPVGTTYSTVYIYKGAMHVMYGGGLPAVMTFDIHVARTDFDPMPVLVIVALQRYNLTDLSACIPGPDYGGEILTKEYPNSTMVFVAPSPDPGVTVRLQWCEDGISETLPANATWQPGARAVVAPGQPVYNTNPVDTIDAAFNTTAYTTTAKGNYYAERADVDGDGRVGIHDAIQVANSIGLTGPPGWIPADVMPDGVVDDFDALMVARMYNWVFNSSFQPTPEAWNLKISTPPGQSKNDSVVVYSDYIVYSNYSFSPALKQLSFNTASSIDGFCNVTIPKTSMSGAFTVYLDDEPTPCIVTRNATCYFVYFNSTGLSQQVRIVSEYADELIGDINHDGSVNILDAILLSNAFLATPSSSNWNPNADINGDNIVNILDAIILSNNFLQHYP